jgi:hypothetical protein
LVQVQVHPPNKAGMLELVYRTDLKSVADRHVGSTPTTRTNYFYIENIMTPEDKLKALELIMQTIRTFYKEKNGGPNHCIPDSALRTLKILFPSGM